MRQILLQNQPATPSSPEAPPEKINTAQRLWLIAEMLLLFVGGPLLLYNLVYGQHIALPLILPPLFVGLLTYLLLQSDQSWRSGIRRRPGRRDIFSILVTFAICGSAIAAYTYVSYPSLFLTLPRFNTLFWLIIMIFYPLVSVTTQELIYRVFFFHRYAIGPRPLLIAVNAALFAAMHAILFAYRTAPFHWEAVALSLAGGLLFGYRFTQTQSYPAVVLEHALYGDLIFTIGLGQFFFTGVAPFRP